MVLWSNLDSILNEVFYAWPTETKPPISYSYDESTKSMKILMALAGFSEEDVSVSFEGSTLIVSGETDSDKAGKFAMRFERSFSLHKGFDLSDSKVKLKNGLLEIAIPFKPVTSKCNLLFGKK